MPDHPEHETADIDCQAALTELYTYLDGELTEARRTLIGHHLDDCNPCLEIYDFEAELRMVIQKRVRTPCPTRFVCESRPSCATSASTRATPRDPARSGPV